MLENSSHSNFRNFDATAAILLLCFNENFSKFHIFVRKCQNSLKNVEKCKNILKCKKVKFRELSESGDNISSFRMNNSMLSLIRIPRRKQRKENAPVASG